jgi:hypothetical protein
MRILLIGNFAPPFEEENLQNISLYNKLLEDGHECSVINISGNPSSDRRFIDTDGSIDYFSKLITHGRKKEVIHFSTKGYLRVGLLKLMLSIFVAKVYGARSIITFHSELFSILGQMRSPFGGTQTLFTSFFLADRIMFADKDTLDVAAMYKKKPNFELVPSFVYAPDKIINEESDISVRLKDKNKVIMFANPVHASFVSEILRELLTGLPLPPATGIVISLPEGSESSFRRETEEIASSLKSNLVFIKPDDVESTLAALSRADMIVRPLSCDGQTFFESFTLSARTISRSGSFIYFPAGTVLVKEGSAAGLCAKIFNTMLSEEPAPPDGFKTGGPCEEIIRIYQGEKG